jgi:ribosome biogenesis GTPase A
MALVISQENVIQWYPGHMATAMRQLVDKMKLIDVVIEVVDARLPLISSNDMLDAVIGKKPRMLVLTHDDLANPAQTVRWLAHYNGQHRRVVAVNSKDPGSISKANFHVGQLTSGKGTQRAIVLGIPNTGKSSIINGLLRRTAAKAEDKAGLTRQMQWFRVQPTLELMDTPGILVPKIASFEAQWMLALTGAIPRERFDAEDVANRFHTWLTATSGGRTKVPSLETFAQTRGFMRKGSEVNYHNAAGSYIKDFNDGKFGRITFEDPPSAG